MTPERFQQIERLFKAALKQDAQERKAFLAQACGTDDSLRAEIETLISAYEQASGFIESPPFQTIDLSNTAYQAEPVIGQLIGHYKILSQIGQGGMGEVYLAQDTRLGRRVALKLLSGQFTKDQDRLRRFRQEARAASALNHPNILTIHDIGEADSIHFMATEFIEGETLRQRTSRSKMELTEALDIAIQVASALSAAHQAGIIHRDIKPENIMLRPDGYVKVLDFGIAKLVEQQAITTETQSPTISRVDTNPGMVIGTPNYMSPEQARGQAVDRRIDIFSLGVVIYEMIAGRRPFEGKTTEDVLVSILQKEPSPLASHSREVPAELQRIVSKVLRKDREERYQTSKDLLLDLKSLKQQLDVETSLRGSAQQDLSGRTTAKKEYGQPVATASMQVMLLYKRNAQPDEQVLKVLEKELLANGHKVFIDRHLTTGMEWAREIERQVRTADAIIVLLSAASITSEMLAYEVQIAHEAAQFQNGKPRLLPVRINYDGALPDPISVILNPLQYALWNGPQDDERLIAELLTSLQTPPNLKPAIVPKKLESIGGAVPLDSEFYIVRSTDEEFTSAIERRDSIVLVKGARQMGKTSLLARGLQQARKAGAKVVFTDFQTLSAAHLESVETFLPTLAQSIADQLDLDVSPDEVWNPSRGPGMNFGRYMRREVLGKITSPLVWGLDEVDRLFTCDYGGEVFGLFRSWHNARALDPTGPWDRLTLAIAYATEAHLFITDMNQSPFNVGTRLVLEDFSFEQVGELNERYGSPLEGTAEVARYYRLVGGHPYLVRRGLHEMATHGTRLSAFESVADRDEGPFGDHLRRILVLLAQDAVLSEVVREVLRGRPCPTMESFYRLRSAGVMSGDSARDVRPRCQLYATYLERHLL